MSGDTIRQRQRPFDGPEKKGDLQHGGSSFNNSGIVQSKSK